MTELLTRDRLIEALERLGADLARRSLFVEIAIYGGSALMLQFEWRQSTDDVDAVVRDGFDERCLAPSVAQVAQAMGLDADWLNDAVGMFTPLHERDEWFEAAGTYPARSQAPGLRVLVASPQYCLAMKLKCLDSFDRGERDFSDAKRLARETGIDRADRLVALYRSIHGENPSSAIVARLGELLA